MNIVCKYRNPVSVIPSAEGDKAEGPAWNGYDTVGGAIGVVGVEFS